ncbi:MAG: Fic family protein [Anaerolineaceae bacterium]|nr:Fic family protein [Anaerolineaceae bacterium]
MIKDGTGEIVCLPPEKEDVPILMKDLVNWIYSRNDLPVPVIAGVAHYQFETIHPFFDGNGHTGRILTNWIFYQGGYDLGKFYALEEFYMRDLQTYYSALVTHPLHNYYFSRNESDHTFWLDYFLHGVSAIFKEVAERVRGEMIEEDYEHKALALLRSLDYRARRVLSLFTTQEFIQSLDVASLLGISVRQSRDLLANWVTDGWLEIADPSKRGRKYRLAKPYQIFLR